MKIIVFEKKLNNAELGIGNVHDCYIREDSDFNFDDLCFVKSEVMSFWCSDNSKFYKGIHYEKFPNESRIAGLGDFFRDFSVTAADTIKLKAQISSENREYFINVKKEENVIVAVKSKNGLEILNSEKLNLVTSSTKYKDYAFSIVFNHKAKKRADAPVLTDFYGIELDGKPFDPELGKIFEIKINNDQVIFRERNNWKKSNFEIGD